MYKKELTGQIQAKDQVPFTCGGFPYCQFMNTQFNTVLPNGIIHKPKHFANCKTIGVIYLLTCQCNRFYVGKTKLEFWKRAYRHISSMTTANPDLPLGRHVRDCHKSIFPQIHFTILDRVHPKPRRETGTNSYSNEKCAGLWNWGQLFPWTSIPNLAIVPFLDGFASGGCEKE